ncbi:MAG: DUF1232 domain-containing protein [Treponema sp.]|nr:DUF1232 domain-containing protein [Treponema sp.]
MKQSDLLEEFARMEKNEYIDKDIEDTLKEEEEVYKKARSGPLAKFKDDLQILFQMLRNKERFSRRTIALILAGIAYIISPLDIVPDLIPVAGLLDDAALLSMILNSISGDIKEYKDSVESR